MRGVVKGFSERSEHLYALRRHHPFRIGKSGLRAESGKLPVAISGGFLGLLFRSEIVPFPLADGASLDHETRFSVNGSFLVFEEFCLSGSGHTNLYLKRPKKLSECIARNRAFSRNLPYFRSRLSLGEEVFRRVA